jgi:hypothetical protein
VAFTRIVTVDLATKAVSEYLYPLANPQETKVAVSEITALTNTTFLVDERDGKLQPGADKKVYVTDIAGGHRCRAKGVGAWRDLQRRRGRTAGGR